LGGLYGVRDREDGQQGSVFYFAVPYRPDEIAAGMLAVRHEAAIAKSPRTRVGSESRVANVKNLVPQVPSQPRSARSHRRSSVSLASSPLNTPDMATVTLNAEKISWKINLAPLTIATENSNPESKPEMFVIDDRLSNKEGGSKNLRKKSFLLQKSFNSEEGGSDMIVKIISPRSKTAALIRTPRRATAITPRKTKTAVESTTDVLKDVSLDSPNDSLPSRETSSKEKAEVQDKKKQPWRFLLVEDSTSIAKMTSMLLKRQGYSVQLASNGVAALDLITRDPTAFDIILMDLQMPVMDGLEATRRIRLLESQQQDLQYRQRIIGLSANNDVDTLSAAFEAGFDAFMEKPIEMDILRSTAAELIN